MELTMQCFNCNHIVPNHPNYFFCPQCVTQIKCKNCNELLVKNAKGCIACGTLISDTSQSKTAVNKIEFEQNGENKKFVANFTDHIGESLVNSLGSVLGGGSFKPISNPFAQSKNTPQLSTNNFEKKEIIIEDAIVVNQGDDNLNASLLNIFRNDEDKLVLINSRVKHTGKRDQAIRISLLLLYSYSILGKQQVKRSILTEVLTSAAVYDNNFISWLSKCDEIKKVGQDSLELNLPGRDTALEILKEFTNPDIEKGGIQFSSSGKSGKRAKLKKNSVESVASESTNKASSKPSKSSITPAKMLDTLISEGYFAEKRRVPEIITYCKDIKGQSVQISPLSVALLRKVKSQIIKRHKNPSDGQYEYHQ